MLTHGIPPAFRDGVYIYRQPPSGQFRVNRVNQSCVPMTFTGEFAGTGPIVLKAVRVTGAAFSGIPMGAIFMRFIFPFFPHPFNTIGMQWTGVIHKV